MAKSAAQSITVLRVAAAWGTTVLSVKHLLAGESFVLGEGRDAIMAMPEGLTGPESPVRAVGTGWEVDARGVSQRLLRLRGREGDRKPLSPAPIPLVPGDWGLLQYGSFSVFFQFGLAPPPLAHQRRYD